MNYTKPEVAPLGTAVHVIEQIPHQKGRYTPSDGAATFVNPAYDLDE